MTRAEFDALKTQQEDTHAMVKELHDALVHPQPGHDKSLIDRMALTTIYLESGRKAGALILWGAGILSAIAGAVAAFRYLGQPPN